MFWQSHNDHALTTPEVPKTGGDQNSPRTDFNATKSAQKATKCVVNAHKIGQNSRGDFAASLIRKGSYPDFSDRLLSLLGDFTALRLLQISISSANRDLRLREYQSGILVAGSRDSDNHATLSFWRSR